MEKILISACLVGDKTRYDGKGSYNPKIKELLKYYELVPFCPEVEGGLSIPRKRSEIRDNLVLDESLKDVTNNFKLGAEKALTICKYLNIKKAILKDFSPSCGIKHIYNGYFNNMIINGLGITARVLEKNKIKLLSEDDIDSLIKEKEDNQKRFEERMEEYRKERKDKKENGSLNKDEKVKIKRKPFNKDIKSKTFRKKSSFNKKSHFNKKTINK